MFRSLAFRIGLALVVIQAVMLAVIVVNSIDNFRHTYEHRLFDAAQNITVQFAATVSQFLFEMDAARLDEYVDLTMTHDELQFVAVYDSAGRLVAQSGAMPDGVYRIGSSNPHALESDFLTITRDIQSNEEYLGRAVLGFSLDLMEKALTEARNQSIVLAGGLVLASVLLAVFVGRTLTRDLAKVSKAVADYGAGNDRLDGLTASTSEVASVVRSLQSMADARDVAQRQRDDSRRFFQALIERSSDMVLVVRQDGVVQFAGPSCRELLSLDPEQVEGRMLEGLASDDASREAIRGHLKGTIFAEVLELKLRNAEGEARTLEAVWQDLTKDGLVRGHVLNCRDVTERHVYEERMRTTEKMEAIGQLTGGIAHDFNNQLAVVMGNLELLDEMSTEAERTRALSEAIKACNRSAELTRNLLSFSRKSHLSPQVLDLNVVVRDASSWIQRTLPAPVGVQTSLLAGLWPTRLDPNALENALLNLVINARDAMPDGGKLVIETCNMRVDEDYLAARAEDLPVGYYVMLAVSDTGTGIAAHDLEKVFQPFFSTKPVGEGSGLGLPSVQGFVRQSGGTVRVYSEPGEGTTVKLFFPATQDVYEAARQAQPEQPVVTTQGARLLVVEDALDVLDLMRRTLEAAGYDVTIARNGDIGYDIFQASPAFDLVITDIVMPGEVMGTRLAKNLRALRPDLPVIFVTGYATEAAMYGNGLRPEDIRLMKPVSRNDLLKAVEKALATRAGPEPTSEKS